MNSITPVLQLKFCETGRGDTLHLFTSVLRMFNMKWVHTLKAAEGLLERFSILLRARQGSSSWPPHALCPFALHRLYLCHWLGSQSGGELFLLVLVVSQSIYSNIIKSSQVVILFNCVKWFVVSCIIMVRRVTYPVCYLK